MHVTFHNTVQTQIIQPNQNFDLSQAILDFSSLNTHELPKTSSIEEITPASREQRNILQRFLNLQDAASTLSQHLKTNGSSLTGSLAMDSSEESLELETDDEDNLLSATTALSDIQTGSFSINGTTFQVDTSSESLSEILTKINNEEVGVEISYDPAEQTVTVESLSKNSMLLENGSSNFFSALGLHEGMLSGDSQNNEESIAIDSQTQLHFNRFTSRFNRLMSSDFKIADQQELQKAMVSLTQNSLNQFINTEFISGNLRLESNVTMNLNSQRAQFLNSSISFEEQDDPNSFLNFLNSSNGLISQLASLHSNKNNLEKPMPFANNKNAFIISTQI
ncbi:MAG: hypothetical protein NE334_06735 [Lentisphaeraceae bacterium]|nr:hypothetical protein [Lentisphaeraceae bacterium]